MKCLIDLYYWLRIDHHFPSKIVLRIVIDYFCLVLISTITYSIHYYLLLDRLDLDALLLRGALNCPDSAARRFFEDDLGGRSKEEDISAVNELGVAIIFISLS